MVLKLRVVRSFGGIPLEIAFCQKYGPAFVCNWNNSLVHLPRFVTVTSRALFEFTYDLCQCRARRKSCPCIIRGVYSSRNGPQGVNRWNDLWAMILHFLSSCKYNPNDTRQWITNPFCLQETAFVLIWYLRSYWTFLNHLGVYRGHGGSNSLI